jgi:hypothetical protein
VDGQYRLEYWVATTTPPGSYPNCPAYTPPP